MKRLVLPLIALLLLCGCAKEPQLNQPAVAAVATQTPTVPTAVATVPPETTEPEIVYPMFAGAVEHFLGELPGGEDFSWEQLYPPEYVMIHFCSAVVDHPDDPYNMEYVRQTFIDADVSIHYIIDRDGTVYCYVPENRTAWHAGKGQWLEDERFTDKMNLYSIGIELVGIGSQQDMSLYMTKAQYKALDKELLGFTDAQYGSLKVLVEDICRRNEIPMDRDHVIGHSEYNPKKNDPGQLFDWSRLFPEA